MTRSTRRDQVLQHGLGAVAVLVAVVLVAMGFAGKGPFSSLRLGADKAAGPTSTTAPSDPGSPATDVVLSLRRFAIGDCVFYEDSVSTKNGVKVVPCDEPHVLEVAGSVDVSGRFDTYPTDGQWQAVRDADCQTLIEMNLLHGPFDADGRYYVGSIEPLEDAWRHGEHDIACGVAAQPTSPPTRADHKMVFSGSAVGQPQGVADPAGTCHTDMVTWPVPCDEPHLWEVTGAVDVTGRTATVPADGDDNAWRALVGRDCERLATDYLGHPPRGDVGSGWRYLSQASWDAGARLVQCTVARYAADTEVATSGSLAGS